LESLFLARAILPPSEQPWHYFKPYRPFEEKIRRAAQQLHDTLCIFNTSAESAIPEIFSYSRSVASMQYDARLLNISEIQMVTFRCRKSSTVWISDFEQQLACVQCKKIPTCHCFAFLTR
jgi:hypothetical protein